MIDKEQTDMLIDICTNLQRIKCAAGREKEIDYQIKAAKAKLETSGIVTEDWISTECKEGGLVETQPLSFYKLNFMKNKI